MASEMLLFPQPFGPTMPVTPPWKDSSCLSQKDLKPTIYDVDGSSHFYNCSANDNDDKKGLMYKKSAACATMPEPESATAGGATLRHDGTLVRQLQQASLDVLGGVSGDINASPVHRDSKRQFALNVERVLMRIRQWPVQKIHRDALAQEAGGALAADEGDIRPVIGGKQCREHESSPHF
jgi:hypothetical protein